MQFRSHYSSSDGNLYEIVAGNGGRHLIDPGIPWSKAEAALGHNLRGIEACFVTHQHQDHCKAAREVMRAGIDAYASVETIEALGIGHWRRFSPIADTEIRRTQSFDVLAFTVEHGDCPGALGYVVRQKEPVEFLLFAVDTAFIRQVFPYEFSIVAIGCNFDSEILAENVKSGRLHESVGKRVVGAHPAAWWVKKYLVESVAKGKLREVHLLHGSEGNLDKDKARRQIAESVPFVEVI